MSEQSETVLRIQHCQVGAHSSNVLHNGQGAQIVTAIEVRSPIIFDLDLSLEALRPDGSAHYARHLRQDQVDVSWLPEGHYQVTWYSPRLALPEGPGQWRITLWHGGLGAAQAVDHKVIDVNIAGAAKGSEMNAGWDVAAIGGTDLAQLSWRRGHEDWFFRHFDHAARTIISYMLGDSPLLKGRILDVGCGDGVTDLSVALRCQPKELVGIDPFSGFQRLPQIMQDNHLGFDQLPPQLRFLAADGNDIPFPDDHFDVVLSWGSLEHIAGGYLKTLKEIRRVLKDGGLFFVHPGLYYSNFGHHLGEFSNEPFFHLTKSENQIKDLVFNTPPQYIDRAGEFSTPEQYWQWYKELNPMTVSCFEKELRELGFQFYRAALRTEDRIEYHHPQLQNYSMQDLATVELYLSAWNKKTS